MIYNTDHTENTLVDDATQVINTLPENIDIQIDGYDILELVGTGGMAKVYKAIQKSFDREVAIKVIDPQQLTDPSFSERFAREAKVVSKLSHPNIITVYDVGKTKTAPDKAPQPFLSMEYVEGKELQTLLKQVSLAQVIKYIKQIAAALNYANQKDIVHRDIKPANIMISEVDDRAILMDFGIAKSKENGLSLTQTGAAVGTPYYMSPEQFKGLTVDHRSDLYSLGVVLYQLLTGEKPYNANSAVSLGMKHAGEPIPTLPHYLQAFQAVIDKSLAKSPDERFQEGHQFVAALEQIPESTINHIAKTFDTGDREELNEINVSNSTIITSHHLEKTQITSHRWLKPTALAASIIMAVIGTGTFLLPDEHVISVKPIPVSVVEEPSTKTDQAEEKLTALSDIQRRKITQLQKQTEQLKQQLDDNLDVAFALKALLEDIKTIDVEHQTYTSYIDDELFAIQQRYQTAINHALGKQQLDVVKTLNQQLLELVPSTSANEFVRITAQRIEKLGNIKQRLAKAEAFIRGNNLTPSDANDTDNALYEYTQVLALQANHPQALTGLKQIKKRYVSLIDHQLSVKNVAQAEEFLRRARNVPGDDGSILDAARQKIEKVKNQQENLRITEEREEQRLKHINARFEQAQKQQKNGEAFEALATYTEILSLNPNHRPAIQAKQNLFTFIFMELKDKIKANKHRQVQASLQALQQVLPDVVQDKHFIAIKKQLNTAISETRKPHISNININGTLLSSQLTTDIMADTNINITCEYDVITLSQKILSIELIAPNNQSIITSEILNKTTGSLTFSFKNNIDFPEGKYRLKFVFNQQVIATHTFTL